MHWIDILIGGCCAAGLVLGIAGRGILHLSLTLAAVVAAAGAGYILAAEAVAAGVAENPRVALVAVSGAVFALLAILWKLLKALPFADGVLKITDALATAFVLSVAAFLTVSVMERQTDFADVQNSILYPKAEDLWRTATGKAALIRELESR